MGVLAGVYAFRDLLREFKHPEFGHWNATCPWKSMAKVQTGKDVAQQILGSAAPCELHDFLEKLREELSSDFLNADKVRSCLLPLSQ